MKTKIKQISILILLLFVTNSCRKEKIIDKTETPTQGFTKTSTVARLLQQVSMHDGSFDNIIDHANSFSIKMPYTVIVNGQTVTIQSEDDLETVEDILDASDTDTDTIQIVFPVTIILSDYTEVVVHNQSEFDAYVAQSTGENEIDDDIECIDFVYPITATVYDAVTTQTTNVTIHNDEEMEDFLDSLDSDMLVSFQFPIHMVLFDGTDISVSNINELQTAIEQADGTCDEDDDNDYNDDDCDNCTQTRLTDALTTCNNWIVDELERNDTDLENNYVDYTFNFTSNGTITATNASQTFSGTWSTTGTGSEIYMTINMTTLTDFNATWHLEEIKQDGTERKIKLKVDDNNKLKLLSTCN
jgi:hypothetical protein